jgi:colanic acid/amylovoran biosynthesis protein
MCLADELGLQYVPAIDTAFLDVPQVRVPAEVTTAIGPAAYTVFVPNALIWHPAYRQADSRRIDAFFMETLNMLLASRPMSKVVMLPQLYNRGVLGDWPYFESLHRQSSQPERIVVLPDSCGSDVQQAIIAKAEFVVGARYHTVVFAINNRVPFVAFSYEHKISGLLALLNLEGRALDIGCLGRPEFDESAALKAFAWMLKQSGSLDEAAVRARAIADSCFQSLVSRLRR